MTKSMQFCTCYTLRPAGIAGFSHQRITPDSGHDARLAGKISKWIAAASTSASCKWRARGNPITIRLVENAMTRSSGVQGLLKFSAWIAAVTRVYQGHATCLNLGSTLRGRVRVGIAHVAIISIIKAPVRKLRGHSLQRSRRVECVAKITLSLCNTLVLGPSKCGNSLSVFRFRDNRPRRTSE